MNVFYILHRERQIFSPDLINKVKAYKRAFYKYIGTDYILLQEGEIKGSELLKYINGEKGKITMLRIRSTAYTLEDAAKLRDLRDEIIKKWKPIREEYYYNEELLEYAGEELDTPLVKFSAIWKDPPANEIMSAFDEKLLSYTFDMEIEVKKDVIYVLRNFTLSDIYEDAKYIIAKKYPSYAVIDSKGKKYIAPTLKDLERILGPEPYANVFVNTLGKWTPGIVVGYDFSLNSLIIRLSSKREPIAFIFDPKERKIVVTEGDIKVEKSEKKPVSLDVIHVFPYEIKKEKTKDKK